MIKGKCPKCNSSRILQSKTGIKCKKCGYENRTDIPENIQKVNHGK